MICKCVILKCIIYIAVCVDKNIFASTIEMVYFNATFNSATAANDVFYPSVSRFSLTIQDVIEVMKSDGASFNLLAIEFDLVTSSNGEVRVTLEPSSESRTVSINFNQSGYRMSTNKLPFNDIYFCKVI